MASHSNFFCGHTSRVRWLFDIGGVLIHYLERGDEPIQM